MSSQPRLYGFPEVTSLASVLRSHLLRCQSQSLARSRHFRIAVSAGSVPETLGISLFGLGQSNSAFDFDKWEIFLADERAVPLDHPDSNFGLLKGFVLDKMPKERMPRVYAIDERHLDDLSELAASYERDLKACFGQGSDASVGFPTFDLILLGCGPDGHMCSLFPGHALLQEKSAWVAHIDDSPKPPPLRVTLTLPVVANANNITFVVLGKEKSETLKQVLDVPGELPTALLNRIAGDRVWWMADGEALEGVQYSRKKWGATDGI